MSTGTKPELSLIDEPLKRGDVERLLSRVGGNSEELNADPQMKAMLIRTLLSSLLQLGTGKGVELALPVPKENSVGTIMTEEK